MANLSKNERITRDSKAQVQAAKIIVDGRWPSDESHILVTLEGLIALVLIYTSKGDHRRASVMLNEGILPRVEERLMMAEKITRERK